MKVSVLIATYNRAYIIREALESVLAQTFRDIEIVLVDDGSTDNTLEIVEAFGCDKLRYIRHEKNRGCSAACNTAIEAARGELVAFLDSDDVWKPQYLEEQINFLQRHPELDAVFSDTEIVNGTQKIPSLISLMKHFPKLLERKPHTQEYVLDKREIYLCLLEEVPIKPSALVVKKKMFEKAGNFDESWPSGTDWDLFLRFSRVGRFGFLNRPLAVQRRTPDATHLKFREKDKLFLLELFVKEKTTLRGDTEALEAVNRGIRSHCQDLGWDYLQAGHRKKSLSAYLRGFQETRDSMMLLRAAFVFFPLRLREALKTNLKGS
jgi:glycosyltransferase involved in cell wall biosynthesis